MGWVKEQPCCICEKPGPSIVDHVRGATAKNNKVLIGHWWLLPLCEIHDRVKTDGSIRVFEMQFGSTCDLWASLIKKYPESCPFEVFESIKQWRI